MVVTTYVRHQSSLDGSVHDRRHGLVESRIREYEYCAGVSAAPALVGQVYREPKSNKTLHLHLNKDLKHEENQTENILLLSDSALRATPAYMQSMPTSFGHPAHSGHCKRRPDEIECADNHPKKVAVNILPKYTVSALDSHK